MIEIGSLQVTGYDSISDILSFDEPHAHLRELQSLNLSGYDSRPSSLTEIFQIYLAGTGVPSQPLSLSSIDLRELASQLGEDLDDKGARCRILLQAATGSSSVLSTTRPSVRMICVCVLYCYCADNVSFVLSSITLDLILKHDRE